MNVAFIGFGNAASGMAKGLKEAGIGDIRFFDENYNAPTYGDVLKKRASEINAISVESLSKLLSESDIVFSSVTGSVALVVASEAAPYLKPDHLFIDVNTASPVVKKKIGVEVEKSGAAFVDAAMMGAISTFLHRVPIFASGGGADLFLEKMEPFGMRITVVGDTPGDASALKMLRSIFQKGLNALLMEMLPAAKHFGAENLILDSIANTFDKKPFRETIRDIFPKAVVSAERMAHEMNDVVETLESAGYPANLTRAVQEKYEWCNNLGLREYFGGDIPDTVENVLDAFDNCFQKTSK